MKKSFFTFIFILCGTVTLVFSQANTAPFKHVVVIGFDGLSPDGIAHANTPTFDKMMQEGSYSLHARSVLPSSSSTNWASMIMGAGPEQHGITSNSWEHDNFILPAVIQEEAFLFPTIFHHIDANIPNATIGAIYHWDGFGRLFEKAAVDYDINPKSEDETANVAANYLKEYKPTFTFIHFDLVDHAGHEYGHGTQEYYASVAKSDKLLEIVWNAVKTAGIADETLIIVSSDHGGIGKGHGGESLNEVEIPFILWGKNIKTNHKLNYPVYQYDNAATVAYAFGFDLPRACIGKPVVEAFKGTTDTYDAYTIIEQQKAPVIFPKAVFSKPAGGLFDQKATITIKNQETIGKVRYTINGSMPNQLSSVYSKSFEVKENTVVKAALFSNGKMISPVSEAFYRIKNNSTVKPISYTLYYLENLKQLPNFKSLELDATGNTFEITSEEIKEPIKSNTAVRFSTTLKITEAGEYTFYIRSDDGSKLYVDSKELINNDGDHGIIEKSGAIKLTPGTYPLVVEWFNGGGSGWLDVYYASDSLPKQILPTTTLMK